MRFDPHKDHQQTPSLDFREMPPDQIGMLLNAIWEARRVLGDRGIVLTMRSQPATDEARTVVR